MATAPTTAIPRGAEAFPRRPWPAREPLSQRRHAARVRARQRVVARVRRPLTAAQRAYHPGSIGRHPLGTRLLIALVILLVSAGIHGGGVGLALLVTHVTPSVLKAPPQRVQIEIREAPPPTAEKRTPEEKPPPKDPDPKVTKRPTPRVVKVTKVEPPKEQPKAQPRRVVGLSLEATTEGPGAGGVAFAVGNTRSGETDRTAAAPKDVAPVDPGPTTKGPSAPTGPVNRKASRIPIAGIKIVLPKRQRPSKPRYPEQLKAQGIEADVTVMVTLDKSGKVTSVKIIRPSPHQAFNEAARKAALAEQFAPALRGGVAIPYTLSFTYRFRLEDQ